LSGWGPPPAQAAAAPDQVRAPMLADVPRRQLGRPPKTRTRNERDRDREKFRGQQLASETGSAVL